MLSCRHNSYTLKQIISKALKHLADEKNIPILDQNKYINSFIKLHVTKGLPLGLITHETLIPTANTLLQHKWTPKLHHDIIVEIHDDIWIPSRTYTHSGLLEYDQLIPPEIHKYNNYHQADFTCWINNYIEKNTLPPYVIYKDQRSPTILAKYRSRVNQPLLLPLIEQFN